MAIRQRRLPPLPEDDELIPRQVSVPGPNGREVKWVRMTVEQAKELSIRTLIYARQPSWREDESYFWHRRYR